MQVDSFGLTLADVKRAGADAYDLESVTCCCGWRSYS